MHYYYYMVCYYISSDNMHSVYNNCIHFSREIMGILCYTLHLQLLLYMWRELHLLEAPIKHCIVVLLGVE